MFSQGKLFFFLIGKFLQNSFISIKWYFSTENYFMKIFSIGSITVLLHLGPQLFHSMEPLQGVYRS